MIDTLVGNIKPVIMEKCEFEYRDLSKSSAFLHSWTIKILTRRIKSTILHRNNLYNKNILIETPIAQIKPKVTGKNEFEKGDESKVIACFLRKFGVSGFECKNQTKSFFIEIPLYKCKQFDWDLNGGS